MTETAFALDPPFGWPIAAALALALLAAALLALARRRAWPRLLVMAAALPLLLNPVRTVIEREAERPLALAIVDDSASMALQNRRAGTAAALATLRSDPAIEWRIVRVAPRSGEGTRLAPALAQALAGAPPGRLGAVVLLTDGAVAAEPLAVPAGVPLHALIAGDPSAADIRLNVSVDTPIAPVNSAVLVHVLVSGASRETPVRWSIDGAPQPELKAQPGQILNLKVPVRRRGRSQIAFEAASKPGELTSINNRALVTLTGVREGLKVLLVSGAPYPGGRVWRDLLKSDDNIQLTHFTILRLPGSFDLTPPEQLALIPFPVDQLFAERLPTFDLVIFDRFALADLLGPDRLVRVAEYVRAGGALLVASGEEFGSPGGLALTPLAPTLPARLTAPPSAAPFRPSLSPMGRDHPITAPFASESTTWGRWPSMANVAAISGAETLLTGADSAPLLVIGESGRGRAAFLASTGLWWWAREVDGAGPRDALLRRLAHWLMREPELEARTLQAAASGGRLRIQARGFPSLRATVAGSGGVQSVPLMDGKADLPIPADGFYRVQAGGLTAVSLAGDSAEFADPTARTASLARMVTASGGAARYLKDGTPAPRIARPGASMSGPSWISVRQASGGAIRSAERSPIVPAWAAWSLLTLALAFSWWKERN